MRNLRQDKQVTVNPLERQKVEQSKRNSRRAKIGTAKAKVKVKQQSKSAVMKNNYQTVSYRHGMKSDFYATREWRELRWKVISTSNGSCVICGRSKQAHGVVLHVDHIKPRSKFPLRELDITNLQILCEDCNLGKSAEFKMDSLLESVPEDVKELASVLKVKMLKNDFLELVIKKKDKPLLTRMKHDALQKFLKQQVASNSPYNVIVVISVID